MSYSHALGNPPTARRTQDRRLAAGQKILVRLRPHGVNSANQSGVFVELDRAMANLGIFGRPEFRGWGGGARTPDSSGMIVYQAPLTTGRYTPTELVAVVARAIRGTEAALGAKRLSVVTVRWLEAPRGALVVYKAPQTTSQTKDRPSGDAPAPASATPEASAADAAAPAADQPGAEPATPGAPATASPATTEENFLTRRVGPVPVWAIGAGVLALGAGLVVFAMRKKPAAMRANSKSSYRRRLSDPNRPEWYGRRPIKPVSVEKHYYIDASGERRELPSSTGESFEPGPGPIYKPSPRRFARKPGSEGYERDQHYVGITQGESIRLSDADDEG